MKKDSILHRPKGKALTAGELATIERAGMPAGVERLTVKDTAVQGLELRLTKSGARTWAFSKRFAKKQRRWALAAVFAEHAPKLVLEDKKTVVTKIETLAEARAVAKWLSFELAQGRDPSAKPEAAAVGEEAPMTLRQLLDEYLETKRSGRRSRSLAERIDHVQRKFASLLDHPAGAITQEHILALLDRANKAGRGKVSAFRAAGYLRPVLAWASSRPSTTGVKANAVALIGKDEMKDLRDEMNHKNGSRVLDAAEIVALWRACERDPSCHYGRLLRFALVTGQRRSECAGLRWEDISLDRRIWRQSENKSSRPHDVPLSSLALEIMGEAGSGLVFPSKGGSAVGGRSGNWSRTIGKYSKLSGVKDWSAHDLRRTFASLLSSLSVSFTVRELLLNHSERTAKGGELGATYDHYDYWPERVEAAERLARHLRGLLDGGPANVVELRRASV